ncbi:hypothetical protein F7D01_05075 [Erythrobacter sp. 3-20A1M]|uniref:hypothetical protein n=1 Tax=Erythrobacter sp. 3-20A1M TaxID=2653850 RepID=UPI001BFC8C53|nr:hypothetical protein [Erythrobacter sp. 3-20A1M]QWC56548.1 hypothetical protein F7D01_05075 [Erythrobacter sp. 3-20A1M]
MSRVALLSLALAVAGCGQGGDGQANCDGPVFEVPSSGATVPQLMAHATAMGMTQREAETLIYLEGLNPQVTIEGGTTICLDGRPDS